MQPGFDYHLPLNFRLPQVRGGLAAVCRWLALVVAGVTTCLTGTGLAASEAAPKPLRVVSMNLCTDQLALLIAAPGQLVSVSFLSHDPDASVLAPLARAVPANHGLAEEVFTAKPDLVLAGMFTARASVAMLQRLGFRVETFAPETSLAGIRTNMLRMGQLLGQEAKSQELVAQFDRNLDSLRASRPLNPPLAATYYANGLTSGSQTLTDDMLDAAGWRNLGSKLGIVGIGGLPLEVLVEQKPRLIIGGGLDEDKPALAYEVQRHPALKAAGGSRMITLGDKYTICGGPFTLEAVRRLIDERATATAASHRVP